MQKFLSMLFSRRALAIVGVVMLALLIWFIGPLVAFDTMHPLASVGSRVPGDADPVVHSTHGTQQPAVRGVERL